MVFGVVLDEIDGVSFRNYRFRGRDLFVPGEEKS